MQERIIYLADDHELVANGLAALLRSIPAVKEVRIYPNGKELYKACLNQLPTHVFLDIEMPEWDGIKTLENLRKDFPKLPCLILSMLNEKSVIENCINKGVNAYLNKDSSLEELQQAIEKVDKGEVFYSKEVQKALSGTIKVIGSSDLNLTEDLTEREFEVLKLLCDGMSSKEIAEKLYLSSRTVESHKNNLMQKFGVNSTGKLIILAIRNKIIR